MHFYAIIVFCANFYQLSKPPIITAISRLFVYIAQNFSVIFHMSYANITINPLKTGKKVGKINAW